MALHPDLDFGTVSFSASKYRLHGVAQLRLTRVEQLSPSLSELILILEH